MIEVEIYRDSEGKICEFRGRLLQRSTGEQAPLQVGVLALLRTAVIGLERYLRLEPEVEEREELFHCKLEREYFLSREIDAILETMVLGLRELEREHPGYLEVREQVSNVKV